MLFLAALAVFGTVFVLVLALGSSSSSMRVRLDQLRGAGPGQRQQPAEQKLSLSERMVVPALQGVVQFVKRVMPMQMLARLEQRLLQAGEPMTVNQYLTMQVVTASTFPLVPVLLVAAGAFALSPVMLGAILAFGVVGFMVPQFWLSQRVGHRRAIIIKSLPDAFDLITTCVEAGLGLDAALARVAEKVEGPFADELSRTLREVGLGKMRRDALRELGERTGVPDLVTFVNAVIQAEAMGSSIGTVLRVQAEQLRVRRRQRAEEQAYKAPIKMLFPLVLCIFPTLFIVILGPAVITILRDFPE
jgi:tight adherence protein C